jgi:hypothetical protein
MSIRRCAAGSCGLYCMWRASEHDAGFHFNPLPVVYVRLEPPLAQSIADGFCLIGKCAEEVDMSHLALFVNYDADWNGVEPLLAKNGVNALNHILAACIIFNTHREPASARTSCGASLVR